MPATAELVGATLAILGLGILTLCSVRSITRRRPPPVIADAERWRC
ncbi:hypothetical protein GCM10010260_64010 [Streptomyces filipinensis]|uniref:Uncharacterized protein n=1 Tax=Streptomyces filipinensis TaxID=66887 RepID=A0A918MEJ0_9ACTN|nr:hypothetical protein [Streptomyces filipinensis]GGV15896.1 hypothetical protein GCM10010260_64010 [Streptomyces filipinensis]